MPNQHRGEIEARLDGKSFRLCLTLGALAELEALYGDADMLALASRFESGRLKSTDAVRLIGAGLRGAGYDITDAAVAAMRCDGGATGFVRIVADLLRATFANAAPRAEAGAGGGTEVPGTPGAAGTAPRERRLPDPFPGAR